jgi:TonB family protein
MPTSEAPAEVNEPKGPAESSLQSDSPAQDSFALKPVSRRKEGPILSLGLTLNASPNPVPNPSPSSDPYSSLDSSQEPSPAQSVEPDEFRSPVAHSSRWIDYDSHELLEMISELEDERRWARLREGTLWAVLVHIMILLALFLLPRYIKVPSVIDSSRNPKDHQDFTYLDTPFLKPPKPVTPLPQHPLIDKQTMEQMKKLAPPATPPPEQQPQVQEQPKPQPSQPIPPNPQSQVEAPRPAAVPAKPNFAMGSQNPSDQLREAMRNSMHGNGQQSNQGASGMAMHPGAGTGAPDILSDTQGVDFSSWLARWHYITQMTWDPLIPDEVNPPILKRGVVAVRFKVLPNGQVTDMQLEGRSGDTALDRAAWGAITGSSYQALPREFHGPYLELRAYFLYNLEPQ